MKTKCVYVVVSRDADIYLEQAVVSITSLKENNKNVAVYIVCDRTTYVRIVNNEFYYGLVKNIVCIDVPEDLEQKAVSRYIKTNLRKYIEGDFLFIDTDTIITSKLDEIDELKSDVAAVLDLHINFQNHIWKQNLIQDMQNYYEIDVSKVKQYFNSGVIYVKDTRLAHDLFDVWHKQWKSAYFNKKRVFDQPALMKANIICGNIIDELNGIYNCQILGSVKYLADASIIHFFNAQWLSEAATYSPFFMHSTYMLVKEHGRITKDILHKINNCKSEFDANTFIVNADQFRFLSNNYIQCLYQASKRNEKWTKILYAQLKIANYLRRRKK